MNVKVVVGANYGDEGKGLVSGCLARQAKQDDEKTLTVFYNGTSQRAHTFKGEIFRSIAGGKLYGSDTFYHKNFVVDPISLWISGETPIIDGDCRVILPCDVISNRKIEAERGAMRHGSCGFGLFEAVKRSKDPKYCIRMKEILSPYELYGRLREVEKVYGHFEDDLYNLDNFMIALSWIKNHCSITGFKNLLEIMPYDTIIFEGGQGLLLDQSNIGDFPHLTPSSTGNSGIWRDISKLGVIPEIYYVTRSYMTRHGAGPMECECDKNDINPLIVDRTNGYNEHQGNLRFGKIDVESLKQRIFEDACFYSWKQINVVVTQTNYTNGKIITPDGYVEIKDVFENAVDIRNGSRINTILVSDQMDQMEVLKGCN